MLDGSLAGLMGVTSAVTVPVAAAPDAVTRPAAGRLTCAGVPATMTVAAVAASKLCVAPTGVSRAIARAVAPAATDTVSTPLAWPANSNEITLPSPAGTSVNV